MQFGASRENAKRSGRRFRRAAVRPERGGESGEFGESVFTRAIDLASRMSSPGALEEGPTRRDTQRAGSAKVRMRSPPRRPRSPPPEPTVTNCSPFTMYTEGDEKTPPPVLNFQSNSPDLA